MMQQPPQLDRERSPKTNEDFLQLIPSPQIGQQGYTQELEDKLLQAWQTADMEEKINSLLLGAPKPGTEDRERPFNFLNNISPLWKRTAVLLGCFPTQVIATEHSLIHENDDGTPAGVDVGWGLPFCDEFIYLAMADACNRYAPTVRAYLQYAVILRTNDTTPWPLVNFSGNVFLDRMIDAIAKDTEPRKPMQQIHKDVKAALYGPGSVLREAQESLVFDQIEHLVVDEDKEIPPTSQLGQPKYKVCTQDLTTVRVACESVTNGLGKPALTAEGVYKWFEDSRDKRPSAPPSVDTIKTAIRNSVRHEMRVRLGYKSLAPSATARAKSPDRGQVQNQNLAASLTEGDGDVDMTQGEAQENAAVHPENPPEDNRGHPARIDASKLTPVDLADVSQTLLRNIAAIPTPWKDALEPFEQVIEEEPGSAAMYPPGFSTNMDA